MQERFDYHEGNASFLVYKDWEQYVEMLSSDEDAGRLFKALFAFAKRGEEPDFEGVLKFAFVMMKNFIERDGRKWEETCEVNRINGKKGGAPKGNKNARKNNPNNRTVEKTTENNPNQPKQPDKEKEKDKDKEKDKEKEKETETEPSAPSPKAQQQQRYGEYRHVLLTEEQHRKLAEEFGEGVITEYIRKIDEWEETRGTKRYRNYALAIRQWLRRDGITGRSEAYATQDGKFAGTAAAEGYI